MTGIAFAIPGDIDLPTGGYAYDRRVLSEWSASGVPARHVRLPGSFPEPSPEDLAETGRLVLSQPFDDVLLIDGLAYGAFPESLAAGLAGRVVALVHHPLGLETGLTPEQASMLIERERAALSHAAGVIATSETTKRLLVADFGVPEARITVAEPGVDPAPFAERREAGGIALLAVGSVVPRKGYDVLVEALSGLQNLPWSLTIVGATDRSPGTADALRARIDAAGLAGRVHIAGALDRASLDAAYAQADLFVMPSLFEGYGMVLTEALVRGLPILCTTGGAAAETVPDGAALKVAPGDAVALGTALRSLLHDKALRDGMADAARRAAPGLPRWDSTAARVADACRRIAR